MLEELLEQIKNKNMANIPDYKAMLTDYRTIDEVFIIVKVDSSGEESRHYYNHVTKCWLSNRLFVGDVVNTGCYFKTQKEAIAFRNSWLTPIETMNTSIMIRPYKVDLQRVAMLSKLVYQ